MADLTLTTFDWIPEPLNGWPILSADGRRGQRKRYSLSPSASR
jgi:hypothetical protein